MYNALRTIGLMLIGALVLVSCESELDLEPRDGRLTADAVFNDPTAYRANLAKIYGGLSLSGQQGPAGNPDLAGLDEGFSNYHRLYFKMQELTTDHAVIAWNDGTIQDLHAQVWTSGNEFIRTMYDRIFYQVALCNEFLRQTEADKLAERGVDATLAAEIDTYRAEARFMRALSYWHAMDLFGNVPFVTDADPIGAFLPEQIERGDLFTYVESELLDIMDDMSAPRAGEYGRADRAAAWMVLAKLYLNAEVYTGTDRSADVLTYTNNIIGAGYSIPDVPYTFGFLADNNSNGAQEEFIFTLNYDGLNSQNFGGMTFMLHAPVGGDMDPAAFGINGGWFGLRTTSALVERFPNEENSDDGRALFFTQNQTKEINDIATFNDGFAITKFRNVDVNGNQGSDTTGDFPDTDFPMFRLADAYLMHAEAELRSTGLTGASVDRINELRERAYGDDSGDIQMGDVDLQFILDERSRELYWENHRRTDLIRFGQFTTNGVWPFKGGVPAGTTTPAFRNLMPLPATDLGVNPNLSQNTGY